MKMRKEKMSEYVSVKAEREVGWIAGQGEIHASGRPHSEWDSLKLKVYRENP